MNIMAAENIAHRLIRELETQVGHGAHDPVIAPPGIFLRHPHHQPLGFLVNSGTTPGFAKLRSVELAGGEHQRPSYLVEADPDSLFGTDEMTAPPVIGE